MTKLHNILSGTPPWVFFVFVYLMIIGIRATKDHRTHIGKKLLMPGIFLALFVSRLTKIARLDICLIFLLAMLVSFAFSHFFLKKELLKVEKSRVFVKGSCETLVVVMIIFCIKYFFGYMKVVHGELEKYLIAEIIGSGITSGFFLNKAMQYIKYALQLR
jgi:hypothetical protein